MSRKTKVLILLAVDSLIIFFVNLFSHFYLLSYIKISSSLFTMIVLINIIFYLFWGFVFNVFTRINRYTNTKEIRAIFLSMTAASICEFFLLLLLDLNDDYRFVLLTYLVANFLIITSRLVWCTIIEAKSKSKVHGNQVYPKQTLIIGAGEAGQLLLNSLHTSAKNSGIKVIGLIDDAPDKYHTYLSGVRVLGNTKQIPNIIKDYDIEMLTLAIPSIHPEQLKRILDIITPLGLPVNSMPDLEEVASGNITISRLKEIDVIDLLGREEVQLNIEQIKDQLSNKVILVTGAGGSIGSEICRQVMNFNPKTLILLGHGENSIYLIEKELHNTFQHTSTEIIPIIADIQDKQQMVEIMKRFHPQIVYHAAAHKHVPLMEYNPQSAIKNNIFGTKNTAEAAKAANVSNFVMISTDKAVNPPNIMGATKRVAELIITNLNKTGNTKFCAVRFGNVLGSRGSVIPLFKEQINKGGPITITDFRMTRYFMTIPEASRLVIQAGALARGGEIFILDMGDPVKIIDLAKNMIKLSGYKENEIKIIETGSRPGEKLYEELLVNKKKNHKQVFDKIFIEDIRGSFPDEVLPFVDNLSMASKSLAEDIIRFANASSH